MSFAVLIKSWRCVSDLQLPNRTVKTRIKRFQRSPFSKQEREVSLIHLKFYCNLQIVNKGLNSSLKKILFLGGERIAIFLALHGNENAIRWKAQKQRDEAFQWFEKKLRKMREEYL